MRRRLKSIQGQHVAFTGKAWRFRSDLQREVRRQGGETSSHGSVNGKTTVLVRGDWADEDYGVKERKAAQLIRKGQKIVVVFGSEFRKLLEAGQPAKIMDRVAGQPIEWLRTQLTNPLRPFRSVAVECPLCSELRRYLPSKVSLGRPDGLVTRQQRTGGISSGTCTPNFRCFRSASPEVTSVLSKSKMPC